MYTRIISLIFALLAAIAITGCGATIRIVPASSAAPAQNMQFSKPEMPVPPPAAYLQRGLTCKLVDSSYRSDSRSTMAVKVDVEECWWLQRSQTGRQEECRNRSRFTTYIGKDQLPGAIPETHLEKVTNCTWREGRGQCHLRVQEDAKLFPKIQGGVIESYRKVHLTKPDESISCR